ncbi:MAG: hypothetical protein MNPFHGCM_02258 [Gemmatimonadaceae bacterium]|nr:hypothetical protein [Gemmatimonadaceae bacterium]
MLLTAFRRSCAAMYVLALVGTQARAQERAVLILLTPSDTFSMERFSRTARQLNSELLIKAAGMRLTLDVALGDRDRVESLRMEARQAASDRASPPAQRAMLVFRDDSVIAELGAAGNVTVQRFATRDGAIPFLNPSFALMELAVVRARGVDRDSTVANLFMVQGGTTVAAGIVRAGRDSVVVTVGGVVVRLAVSSNGEILGGTIPAQGLRLVRVPDMGEGAMAAAPPDYSPPPGAPYTAEAVTVPTPMGHTLAGTLTMPTNARGPVPALVTITGSGSQDRDEAISLVKGYRPFRQVADTLARHGIAVLRMDDRGYGSSGGNAATATSADFADDIRAGLAYLRSRSDIDSRRLGLIGHSEGGLIAPMVAAQDSTLRGIVLLAAPAEGGRRILEYQQRFAIEHAPNLTAPQRDSAMRRIAPTIDSLAKSAPWMGFFVDYDPLETARRVRVPVLILQGATDRQVTAGQAEALARAIRSDGNGDVTVRVFPGTNHLFVSDPDGNPAGYAALPSHAVRSDVLAAILEWVVARMK